MGSGVQGLLDEVFVHAGEDDQHVRPVEQIPGGGVDAGNREAPRGRAGTIGVAVGEGDHVERRVTGEDRQVQPEGGGTAPGDRQPPRRDGPGHGDTSDELQAPTAPW